MGGGGGGGERDTKSNEGTVASNKRVLYGRGAVCVIRVCWDGGQAQPRFSIVHYCRVALSYTCLLTSYSRGAAEVRPQNATARVSQRPVLRPERAMRRQLSKHQPVLVRIALYVGVEN